MNSPYLPSGHDPASSPWAHPCPREPAHRRRRRLRASGARIRAGRSLGAHRARARAEEGLRLAIEARPDVILLTSTCRAWTASSLCRHLKETRARATSRSFPHDRGERAAPGARARARRHRLHPQALDPIELRARRGGAAPRPHDRALRDQAWIDPLTGLKNRAALDDALEAATAAFERVGQPAALLLLDLDHFKRVNDEHGHGIGDELLRAVGAAIRASCRPYDTAARFGGDEFAVLYTQIEASAARHAAERLLDAVRKASSGAARGGVRARASAGLVTAESGDERFSAAELLKAADEALYQRSAPGASGWSCGPGARGGCRRRLLRSRAIWCWVLLVAARRHRDQAASRGRRSRRACPPRRSP